mmetsp:Transcript_33363/g.80694  ORF Transcript_33363/g.80694 Transcript_33363/m.80694 type:complete len:236 (+) Transcript_33363:161-868(+)
MPCHGTLSSNILEHLISLVHSLRHIPHVIVDLARRCPQDQIANSIPRHSNITVTTQHMYPRVGDNNPSPCRIFYGKARLTILTRHAANRSREMITPQYLHVSDLEGFDVQIIQTEQCNGILRFESHHEGPDEVGALLQARRVQRVPRGLHLHGSGARVKSHLELQIFHEGSQELFPILAQGRVSMRRTADAAVFGLSARARGVGGEFLKGRLLYCVGSMVLRLHFIVGVVAGIFL